MAARSRVIVLSNLGSPDSPEPHDVRRYLDEFLMDGRVLDVPWPVRRLIVSAFILPRRPRESAEAYRSIWWDEGSPLVVISRRVTAAVQAAVDVPVELGMRYGRPSIGEAIDRAIERAGGRVESVYFVALYPHYAMSTVETAVEKARDHLRRVHPGVRLDVHPPFFDHPAYVEALVDSAREVLGRGYDHLLLSYHGLPERHLRKTDPTGRHCLRTPNCCSMPSAAFATCYRAQCFRTTEEFAARTGLPPDRYSVAFQSRLGRDRWLEPATSDEIVRLARRGVKRLRVICPSFVSDCLETLEEIGIRGREAFLEAGGEDFALVPCLNENPLWVDTLVRWCRAAAAGRSPAQVLGWERRERTDP